MHLAPTSFDPQLIKTEILQYHKGLIASIKNNHALVGQSFHSAHSGDKDLKHHTLQTRDFCLLEKTLSEELSTASLGRPLSSTANQTLVPPNSKEFLDAHDTSKESTGS